MADLAVAPSASAAVAPQSWLLGLRPCQRGRSRSAPASASHRLNVLRGVAVLGILLMNVVGMGLPFAAYSDPTIAGNHGPADFWGVGGERGPHRWEDAGHPSMLFGASVILITSRIETRGADSAADVHVRATSG